MAKGVRVGKRRVGENKVRDVSVIGEHVRRECGIRRELVLDGVVGAYSGGVVNVAAV
jgi:hypothetical protein